MPETFDLQTSFDELARDVARAAGPGDATVPVRRARRRRGVAGAAAMAVAVTVGVAALQVVGDDPDSGVADRLGQTSPGQERRERLLALLPPDSPQVGVVDVEGFTGEVGLDATDLVHRELHGYVLAGFVRLQQGPLPQLLLPDLVTWAGTGWTDLFLVDRRPEEITAQMVRAGWQDQGGTLVPGPDVPRLSARLAAHVRVTDEQGRALVAVADDREGLPAVGASDRGMGPAASRLVELGGAVGFSIDLTEECALAAVSLVSPTQGSVLVVPPSGVAPEDVTARDLEAPSGFSSVDAVAAAGESVRAAVTVPGPAGPLDVVSRLGLPGSEFC